MRINRWKKYDRINFAPVFETLLIRGRIRKNNIKFREFRLVDFSENKGHNAIRNLCESWNLSEIIIIQIKKMTRNRMCVKNFLRIFRKHPNTRRSFIGKEKSGIIRNFFFFIDNFERIFFIKIFSKSE